MHQFGSLKSIGPTIPRGDPRYWLEGIVLENVHALTATSMSDSNTDDIKSSAHSVVCTQIIDLLLPTGGPDVFADKFDSI
jgi:hypothetical protein